MTWACANLHAVIWGNYEILICPIRPEIVLCGKKVIFVENTGGIDMELFSIWSISTGNRAYMIENILFLNPLGLLWRGRFRQQEVVGDAPGWEAWPAWD